MKFAHIALVAIAHVFTLIFAHGVTVEIGGLVRDEIVVNAFDSLSETARAQLDRLIAQVRYEEGAQP